MAIIYFKRPESEEYETLEVPDDCLKNCSDSEEFAMEIKEYFYASLSVDDETTEELDEKIDSLTFLGGDDFWSAVVIPLYNEFCQDSEYDEDSCYNEDNEFFDDCW